MSTAFSVFVTVITIAMLAGCWLLLALTRRNEIDDGEHVEKDHVFDGITELETPLPRWWYYWFLGTIVFAAFYLVLFPGLGNFAGVLGWTQDNQWQAEVDRADARYAPLFARYEGTPIPELAQDPKALAMGQRIFGNFCSQCHGTAAQGYPGFPNLTDDAWIWGDSPEAIKASIVHGRQAAMPPWGPALGEQGVADVTSYVLSLAGRADDAAAAERGAAQYASLCIACHGPQGKGNALLGAPDLTDDAWLYGGDAAAIATSIAEGRNGVMPAHSDLLDAARIHLVATWVYAQSAPPQDAAASSGTETAAPRAQIARSAVSAADDPGAP